MIDWRTAFAESWKLLFTAPVPDTAGIEAAYAGRAYHNIEHIVYLYTTAITDLNAMGEVGTDVDLFTDDAGLASLIIAIVFHDIIYDATVGGGLNEKFSANDFFYRLDSSTYNNHAERIHTAICLTTHSTDAAQALPWQRYLLDLDLHGISAPYAVFAANTAAIRIEYAHLSEAEWVAGRIAFWNALLARPAIYYNPYGTDSWAQCEQRARENIRRELAELMAVCNAL